MACWLKGTQVSEAAALGFTSFGSRTLEPAGFISCDSQAPEQGLASCGTIAPRHAESSRTRG